MELAIETEGLTHRAGRGFAIRDVGLRVPRGEVCGFLGPNGAGKTTVIRLLLGLLRPDAGHVRLGGRAMPAEAPTILAGVGYVPERPHFDATLPCAELLRYQAAFFRRWDRALAAELADRFELDLRKEFGRLSKGQKAKLMILAALAQRPDLLLLDEPTDGLDPVIRREILDILLARVRADGVSVLISSHLVHELEGLCTRIAIMDAGTLVTEQGMHEFRMGPARRATPLGLEDAYVQVLRAARAGRS
ncbi:MAG TPA: ABC transporter ATP-binding protein [Gemmatimonadales bacterium]|nr:ABC transporter ATP-binding protein [Gemmatimonadales bacterium]